MAATTETTHDDPSAAAEATAELAPLRPSRDGRKSPDASKSPAQASNSPSVAGHPRAAARVRQAKEWAGLAGFLLGGYLSLPTHTLLDAGLRALVAGVVLYVAAWGAAVFLWRYLVVAEIKDRERALVEAMIARASGSEEPSPPRAGRSRAQGGA